MTSAQKNVRFKNFALNNYENAAKNPHNYRPTDGKLNIYEGWSLFLKNSNDLYWTIINLFRRTLWFKGISEYVMESDRNKGWIEINRQKRQQVERSQEGEVQSEGQFP